MQGKIGIFSNLVLFQPNDLEFEHYYLQNSIRGIRVGLCLGIFLFLAFGFIVDTLAIQWIIRAGVILPILLISLLLSYTDIFKVYSQTILALVYLSVSVALIFMIYFTPHHASRDVYSTGLALVLFGAGVLRLRVRPNMLITPLILCFYLYLFHKNHNELLIHIPLLISASLLALISTTYAVSAMKENFQTLKTLRSERMKLAESDNLKSKLLSIISHDLKAPMNNVLTLMQLYNSGSITGAELGKLLQDVERSACGAKELLESLLTWSAHKIKGDQNLAAVNARSIVEQVSQSLQHSAASKGNNLINEVSSWVIYTDSRLVTLVLRNIIANAIKFTSGGTISIQGSRLRNGIRFIVRDTGTGIPKEAMERLFDWNYRYTSLGTAGEKGTGLGLLICRDFLESIGGNILVESWEGTGTVFYIDIQAEIINEQEQQEELLEADHVLTLAPTAHAPVSSRNSGN